MAITDTARKNHDELFPGHVSTLKVTDPELIEVFDNFALDEVLACSRLDVRTRLMVQLAALIGGQALSEYRVMLGAALTAGVTPVEAREIVYQAVPYTGMGRAYDFLHATNEVGDHVARAGIGVPVRELLTFAFLAALGGCDAQVRGHVAGNLTVGNGRPTLIDVITVLLPFIGYPRALNALGPSTRSRPPPGKDTDHRPFPARRITTA